MLFLLKTSRVGKPKTFTDLEKLMLAIREDLEGKVAGMGAGKIIIEVRRS